MQRTTVWSWLIGGMLLIAQSALSLTAVFARADGDPVAPTAALGAAACTFVACAVFAIGVNRSESVVGRRPGGILVLMSLGVVSLVEAAGRGSADGASTVLGAAAVYALTLAAAIVIARAGVVPAPWSWIPLAAVSLALALSLFFAVMVPLLAPHAAGVKAWTLPATMPALIGVVSIVLAVTTRPGAARAAAMGPQVSHG
ncbi:hypothetical protein [Microbacterium sp.]|uniref:hypothetical protein n=1 Tax=Microbacterium sp. TaxID=51671 RepID=UPI003736DB01